MYQSTIGPSDHTVYLLTYGSDHPARWLLNCLQQTLGENYTASYFFNSLQARFLVNHLFCFWKSFKSFIMIYQTAPLAPNTLLAFSMYLQLLQNSGECELESDSCKRCKIKIFSRTIYFLSVVDDWRPRPRFHEKMWVSQTKQASTKSVRQVAR